MPAPTISPLPAAPSRTQSPDDFTTTADAFVAALPTLVTETNAATEYVEDTAIAADASATAAAGSASTATTQAGNAATSALLSQDWATKTDGPVSGAEESAKKHAQYAAASMASVLNAGNTVSSSTTSLSLSVGSKVLTVQAGKAYAPGQFVVISLGTDLTQFMYGTVTDYAGTSLTVNVTLVQGSGGPHTSWTINGAAPILHNPLLSLDAGSQRYILGIY